MRFVYNALGQKVQEIEDDGGLNLTTSYTYDRNGNLETKTDPEGMVTRYTYDALNRLTGETQGEGGLNLITTYRYDLGGNLRFLTDAKSQTTEMVYDAMNRLKQEIRPMSEETAYWYDEAGNLEQKQDAKGQTTTYTYNTADQLTQISYADGKTVTFTYDRVGNLETYNDGATSAVYTYDDLNRKVSETVQYPGFSKTFSYTYYANSLKQSFTMPDGTIYDYTYDENDQLTSISLPGVGEIEYPSYTLTRPDSVTFPGGSQQTYQYDAIMRLEQISVTASGLDYEYDYDNVSNILTKTTEHGNYVYGYDDVYRLTSADNPTLDDEAYTYDGVGNRLTSADVSGSWSYNQNNELLGYADVEYTYDANGNMTQKRVGTAAVNYIYNVENRLIRVEDDATQTVIAEYYYDPFGRRLWKEVDGTRTYFFYADEGLVAEYDENGVELRSYGYQPDSTWTTDSLFLKQEGSYYWYQNDHLGTPQKLVDSTGTVVWSAQYTSFGNATIDVNTVENPLRFPGQYEDAETGLYYNYYRYYDSRIGRYLRMDPIGLEGGDINFYAYALNNPIHEMDNFGLQGGPAEAAIAGIGTCLATPVCREALIAGTFLGSVALCRALGGCQSLPVDEPLWLPPMSPPVSPSFPLVPPITGMCDPYAIPIPKAVPIPKARRIPTPQQKCNPCIPPVGSVAAEVHTVPPHDLHWPLPGSHIHWFQMHQSPYPQCRCFWKRDFIPPTSGSSLPPGVPPVTPAAGGGPMP